nr:copia protein [Tanacetum cinerariifolium]
MQRPLLFEANCFIYWKNHFKTYVKSKDIDIWCIIVYGDYKPTIKDKDEFIISDDETIDFAFARFNTIITSLKSLDESFSSRNHVGKFLRALPTKWHPKVTAIEESKDLSTLSLDELIGNLKVYEVVLEKDFETSRNKKEKYKSLALKARKVPSEEEATSSNSNDEEYAMVVRDFKKFFRRREKFVREPHDDKRDFRKAKIMHDEFEMSMMGELNFFIGLQIKQLEDEIFFNQSKYVKEMLKKFGLEDSKPIKTPMASETKHTQDEDGEPIDDTKYHGMIGLWYPKGTRVETIVYSDSDHAGDYVDRKSTSGVDNIVLPYGRISFDILVPSIRFPLLRVMSSPNHPTSDIKDAFSSNFPDYIPASPDFVLASSGKTFSKFSNDSFGLVPIALPTLSLFHDDPYMKVMHAYYAKELPIPPPVIVPPSPMLSLIFNP